MRPSGAFPSGSPIIILYVHYYYYYYYGIIRLPWRAEGLRSIQKPELRNEDVFQLSLREDKANRLSISSEGRNNTHTGHLCLKATCQLYLFLAVLVFRRLNDRQELFIQLNRTFAKYYRSFCVGLNAVQVTKLKNNKQHFTPREYKQKRVVRGSTTWIGRLFQPSRNIHR
jgi:hypothetical protein